MTDTTPESKRVEKDVDSLKRMQAENRELRRVLYEKGQITAATFIIGAIIVIVAADLLSYGNSSVIIGAFAAYQILATFFLWLPNWPRNKPTTPRRPGPKSWDSDRSN